MNTTNSGSYIAPDPDYAAHILRSGQVMASVTIRLPSGDRTTVIWGHTPHAARRAEGAS